jgi:hypothetical protein
MVGERVYGMWQCFSQFGSLAIRFDIVRENIHLHKATVNQFLHFLPPEFLPLSPDLVHKLLLGAVGLVGHNCQVHRYL